jgi:hypothetical protein
MASAIKSNASGCSRSIARKTNDALTIAAITDIAATSALGGETRRRFNSKATAGCGGPCSSGLRTLSVVSGDIARLYTSRRRSVNAAMAMERAA